MNEMIKTILLVSLLLMAFIAITQQQANAQDGWKTLLKITKNFTETCIAEGHTNAECTEMSKNIGK
jgi:hypothetical protein